MSYKFNLSAFVIALITFAMPLSAAKINIHITKGGTSATVQNNSRLPTYVGSTPVPIVPGTEDVMDCHQIALDNIDYLRTTEAGAICNAVAQVQEHLRDKVELDIEVVILNFAAIGQPLASGLSSTAVAQSLPSQENKNNFQNAYNSIVTQLKKKHGNNVTKNSLIPHLPLYNQLNTILPNYDELNAVLPDNYPDPDFYENNPAFKNNRWKPSSFGLSTSQLKALGVKPNLSTDIFRISAANFKHADILDFGILLASANAAAAGIVFDLDTSDGVGMQGPYSRDVYNSIDFTNPATWPPGFNTELPKRINDLQGIMMHELIHGLGFISFIGGSPTSGNITLPPPASVPLVDQAITLLDLYRFKKSDLDAMKSISDFQSAPRYWALDFQPNTLRICNQDRGTAVAALYFNKDGFHSAPLASGNYTTSNAAIRNHYGDGLQASHFRNPMNWVPKPGQEAAACDNASQVAVKAFYFFEDPPGRLMRGQAGYHNPVRLTNDDLAMLSLIGWDVDFDGNQSTVLDPNDPLDLNSALVPQDVFEKANGIKFKNSETTIVD